MFFGTILQFSAQTMKKHPGTFGNVSGMLGLAEDKYKIYVQKRTLVCLPDWTLSDAIIKFL